MTTAGVEIEYVNGTHPLTVSESRKQEVECMAADMGADLVRLGLTSNQRYYAQFYGADGFICVKYLLPIAGWSDQIVFG